MNAVGRSAEARETIARLAPGTALRDGLERILRGRTGALIVLGYDAEMEKLCDGGFELDVEFAATRLRELSKMDGAVVLSTDGSRIVRANVQLVPDHRIPTVESGTRHRAAERTAIHTGYPVISVSQSTRIVSVYIAGHRYVLEGSDTLLSRANQAVATLERYKSRADEVTRQLSVVEIEDFVTLRDALVVIQRLEMVRRVSGEIELYVLELGTDGRQLAMQLEDLVGDNHEARELMVRDYVAGSGPARREDVDAVLAWLGRLSDTELLDLTALARTLGYPATIETLDASMSPRGYRVLHRVPRLQFRQIDRVVGAFGTLQGLLAATAADIEAVEGIGTSYARHIREGLSRLAESAVTNPYD
ncbi:DNA integrity scanning protein DisA [Rhodococcus rhodnii]|uniref:DNA integrity scanning protein DisA n=2 Tax=Rhodococcus rhodnii TaxID=38312 RepID=R7WIZ6_9NOCA|nr:DNA integrity scanning diadenylate cyclase DisA [Rhodococcus rhodnii]EOM75232.1 DNA integrity scanning protein DisA [Rhodococcus rhodnii LMG 5362]TXG89252.1 DNA integrity scanning protein DisA [Rhodococcus rhodnii]